MIYLKVHQLGTRSHASRPAVWARIDTKTKKNWEGKEREGGRERKAGRDANGGHWRAADTSEDLWSSEKEIRETKAVGRQSGGHQIVEIYLTDTMSSK